jgi:hypothetical protein
MIDCASLVWPSLSADTLRRLHNMLLEQPHTTVQHKEILASHFGVEIKHVENFLNWRVACLHPEPGDSHVWREEDPPRGHDPLSPAAAGGDNIMDLDEPPEPHLPTPAGSTSPEPLYRKRPLVPIQMHYQPPVEANPSACNEHGPSCWPPSPSSILESSFPSPLSPLRILSNANATPHHVNSPATMTHNPSSPRNQLSHAQPIRHLPLSFSALPKAPSGDASGVTSGTGQKDQTHVPVTRAAVEPPQAGASPVPRTLRELEEAYAPAYMRIEQFLRNVGNGKCAHVGLMPDMLNDTKP